MIEDLDRYSKDVKLAVQNIFLARDEEGRKRITDLCDSFKVPCIVVVLWCGEVSEWPEYLKKTADNLIKFYGYTEIKNKQVGCPW